MGPPLYMRSVFERNVVMQRIYIYIYIYIYDIQFEISKQIILKLNKVRHVYYFS